MRNMTSLTVKQNVLGTTSSPSTSVRIVDFSFGFLTTIWIYCSATLPWKCPSAKKKPQVFSLAPMLLPLLPATRLLSLNLPRPGKKKGEVQEVFYAYPTLPMTTQSENWIGVPTFANGRSWHKVSTWLVNFECHSFKYLSYLYRTLSEPPLPSLQCILSSCSVRLQKWRGFWLLSRQL